MGKEDFAALLLALQSSLARAQAALEEKRKDEPSSLLIFAIPRNGARGDEFETLSLPASSFRSALRPQVSLLTFTFECELEQGWFPGTSRVYSVVIGPEGNGPGWRKARHQMQIVFYGTACPSGEVRIDGRLLMAIPRYGEGDANRAQSGAKPSFFSKALNALRNLWRPQGFLLTVEQSKRLREILKQSPAEIMTSGDMVSL